MRAVKMRVALGSRLRLMSIKFLKIVFSRHRTSRLSRLQNNAFNPFFLYTFKTYMERTYCLLDIYTLSRVLSINTRLIHETDRRREYADKKGTSNGKGRKKSEIGMKMEARKKRKCRGLLLSHRSLRAVARMVCEIIPSWAPDA